MRTDYLGIIDYWEDINSEKFHLLKKLIVGTALIAHHS